MTLTVLRALVAPLALPLYYIGLVVDLAANRIPVRSPR